jgi:RNA polymerase sigma-70 factor (ECF subfamily)
MRKFGFVKREISFSVQKFSTKITLKVQTEFWYPPEILVSRIHAAMMLHPHSLLPFLCTMSSPSPDTEHEFEQAYNEYADAIFRHCYFRVFDRERGKELMQEAFMRAWNFLCDGKKIDNMRAFLYRVANNLIVDEIRKKKEVSLDALQKGGWDPGYDETPDMHRRLEQGKVLVTLRQMDKDYRDVLIMRYIDGIPPADIAGILGESANTISVRLHRGIKQLRSHMNKADGNPLAGLTKSL